MLRRKLEAGTFFSEDSEGILVTGKGRGDSDGNPAAVLPVFADEAIAVGRKRHGFHLEDFIAVQIKHLLFGL